MNKTFVIKLGGEVVQSAEMPIIAADLKTLQQSNISVVIVHGGGPQATALSKRLGLTPNIVGGRRITDEATLDVMKMTVAGQVNVDLCSALLRAQVKALGLHGASHQVIRAVKRPPKVVPGAGPDPIDFGHVGDVTQVDTELLNWITQRGIIPVLACLGAADDGALFNINADTVANQVAIAMGADALILVTDVPAVLRDVQDPTSRIAQMTAAEGEKAIAEGVVTKGMIPKLEESFAAIKAGVKSVNIVGKLSPGQLAQAALSPGEVGTLLVALLDNREQST